MPNRAKGCILYLVEGEALTEMEQVNELLRWGGCEDFNETDWDGPLWNLRSSKPKTSQQVVPAYNNLPHGRNSLFTGRQDALKRLLDIFLDRKDNGASVAICGLAGMGKTQLVVEYVSRYQSMYHAILWVNADSYNAMVADFVVLAGILDLPEKHEQNHLLVIHAVRNWLSNHLGWLLIFDNVTDFNILSEFLPPEHQGHLVLTTQAQILYADMHKVDLEKMSVEEGALLLLRRADMVDLTWPLDQVSSEDRLKALAIVDELDGLPLALDQAGAYIQGGRCDMEEYLELYKIRRMQLLSTRSAIHHGHPASVVTTFTLLFERVQESNRVAIDLLRFTAFLHPDAIPKEIAMNGLYSLDADSSKVIVDPVQWHDALDDLLKYSLLRLLNDDALTMHRLVQAVLQDTMEISVQQHLVASIIHAIYHAMISTDQETMSGYGRYLPHAQHITPFIERWEEVRFAETAYLLLEVGRYLRVMGLYEQAEKYCYSSVEIIETHRGLKHIDRAIAYSNLANLYLAQGKYGDARKYFWQSVVIIERQSPNVDEALLGLSYCNIANCDRHLNKLAEAETEALRARNIIERVRGSVHSEVAYCLNILATIYRDQERYTEAAAQYERALIIREQVHAPDHPAVAAALNDLATVYVALEEYEKSEPLNQRALAIYKKAYGLNHPEVARCLICLSDFYSYQGDFAQAEQCNREALAIYEKTIGIDHPRAIEPLGNIAVFSVKQKNYRQAQKNFRQALKLGEKYPYEDIGWIVRGYARLLESAGQMDAAIGLKQTFKNRLSGGENL
ncbi:tetratricopeptide repeat protein [Dictyobacter arantiisoli]|uniref:Tetratricopeptide repeat protein n=1 Tax=Dictyobacter arantiisoli TaxID=2014874 RepID=A0A5A5TH21_9CHLR|nr:tetratricopeptide repeat protein [Dictyobacter arantiisoli]GCF10535.1 tetratricopeptide repeat protein [Dictyobacter arantiisoli]